MVKFTVLRLADLPILELDSETSPLAAEGVLLDVRILGRDTRLRWVHGGCITLLRRELIGPA